MPEIKVTMHALSGNPDLYLLSCEDPTDTEDGEAPTCIFDKNLIEGWVDNANSNSSMVDDTKPFKISSLNKLGNDQIVFNTAPPACRQDQNACYFALGVYGNTQEETTVSHFSLLATHSYTYTILQDHVPIRQSIKEGEYQYYKFSVPDDSGISAVHF